MIRSSAAVVLCVVLASCTFIKEHLGMIAKKPQMTLESVQLKGVSINKMELNVRVNVDNPNSFDLGFAELRYKLKLNNDPIAEGSVPENIKIPAKAKVVVDLPLNIETPKLIGLLRSFVFKKSDLISKWEVDCKFDSPVGSIDVSFTDEKPIWLNPKDSH